MQKADPILTRSVPMHKSLSTTLVTRESQLDKKRQLQFLSTAPNAIAPKVPQSLEFKEERAV
jgi:hypothetical protein